MLVRFCGNVPVLLFHATETEGTIIIITTATTNMTADFHYYVYTKTVATSMSLAAKKKKYRPLAFAKKVNVVQLVPQTSLVIVK